MDPVNAYKELSPEEVHRWIEEKKPFYLIDLLKSDTFCIRHLPNALNACVFEVTFIDQIRAITDDTDAEIVLYGAGSRSFDARMAAEKLARQGYRNMYLLRGGIEAWRSAGLSLEGDAVDQPTDPQTLLKLEDRVYRIDADQSSIEWRGRNSTTTHYGTVRIVGGELRVKDGSITGVFDIDMDSITNTNLAGNDLQPVLIAHLKSDDFFLTGFFPKARFEITEARPVDEPFLSIPNYVIHGTLELRGQKAQQDFVATITQGPENDLKVEAHFDIDRTRWGVIYGSSRYFEYLGMHMVFDLISLQVRIVAN